MVTFRCFDNEMRGLSQRELVMNWGCPDPCRSDGRNRGPFESWKLVRASVDEYQTFNVVSDSF